MPQFYFLDLLGSFAFATYGAYFSARKGFDIFGIFISAAASALGGGTIRDILLNRLPGYFIDYNYFLAVIVGVIFAMVFFKKFKNPNFNFYMLVVDAIGLVTFAYIGTLHAVEANLGLLGILVFAVLTAVGGGVLRDLLIGEVPYIFDHDFYATPVLLFGIIYFLGKDIFNNQFELYALLLFTFVVRVVAIKFNIQLWKPIKLK